ncbi:hypothetical protein GCM10025780_26550 [Frondihabitans cladoniiphilus]|uniref:Secreted protein n=1 Tax=Frondihabitans cladoniiphilus TaxID=715785 RepID=A0ABP8W346_9MICO
MTGSSLVRSAGWATVSIFVLAVDDPEADEDDDEPEVAPPEEHAARTTTSAAAGRTAAIRLGLARKVVLRDMVRLSDSGSAKQPKEG